MVRAHLGEGLRASANSSGNRMRLQLFRDVDVASKRERLDKEPRWADLQTAVTIVWTANGEPVRQIAPRSRIPVGRYNSRKAGRMLHHESRGHGRVGGEKLALMCCEISPAVADFRSQHIRFDLLIDGEVQHYFPDIIALMDNGSILVVEVQGTGARNAGAAYRKRTAIVRDICADLGWGFEAWTETIMAPTARIRDNITQIQMQRFVSIDDVQIHLVAHAFQRNDGSLSVGEIKHILGNMPGAGDLVRALMCRRVLHLPLDAMIHDATVATMFEVCAAPRLEHAT